VSLSYSGAGYNARHCCLLCPVKRAGALPFPVCCVCVFVRPLRQVVALWCECKRCNARYIERVIPDLVLGVTPYGRVVPGRVFFRGDLRALCACVRVYLPANLPGEHYRTLRERHGFMRYTCRIAVCRLCGVSGYLTVARRSIAGTVILCGIC